MYTFKLSRLTVLIVFILLGTQVTSAQLVTLPDETRTGYSIDVTPSKVSAKDNTLYGEIVYAITSGSTATLTVPSTTTVSKIVVMGTSNDNANSSIDISECNCTSADNVLNGRKSAVKELEFVPTATTTQYVIKSNTKGSYIKVQVYGSEIIKKNIELSAPAITLNQGGTSTISVSAKDEDGITVSGLAYTYTSSDETIAMVDAATGEVTAVSVGNAVITISFAGDSDYNEAEGTVNVTVKSNAADGTKVFQNIADLRAVGHLHPNSEFSALVFDSSNPATVVAVFKNNDSDMANGSEGAGNVFLIDKTGYGIMIPYNDKSKNYIKDLVAGDKITGTFVAKYKERTSKTPEISEMQTSYTFAGTTYTTGITDIDRTGEATLTTEAVVPINAIADVNTLANYNNSGNAMDSSFGPYLHTVVDVPGTIVKNGSEYYLVDPGHAWNDIQNRIYFNNDQIDGVNIDTYVGATGDFRGLLIKRNNTESKLVLISATYFKNVTEITISEEFENSKNLKQMFDDGQELKDVTVNVHRTGINSSYFSTLSLPFTISKTKFAEAIGCGSLKTYVFSGVSDGRMQFTESTNSNIIAGTPYIVKPTGNQSSVDFAFEHVTISQEAQNLMGNMVTESADDKDYGFFPWGDYTMLDADQDHKEQYISTDGFLKYAKDASVKVKGLRACVYLPWWVAGENEGVITNGEVSQSKIMILDQTATGITDIASVPLSTGIYTLSGRYMGTSTGNLSKGIYIINGRKTIIK